MSLKEECQLDLQCRHNLSGRPARHENVSEVKQAMYQINSAKRVEAGLPFCFVKSQIVRHENRTYFNTARVSPITRKMDGAYAREGAIKI